MEHLPNSSAGSTDNFEETNIDKHCHDMCKLKKQLFSKADQNIKKAQDRYKRDYDRKHHRKKVCHAIYT
jgi:hypothetical protein